MKILKRLIAKIKHNRVCRANGYNCPECIYHDFIFEDCIFRGNQCREPNWKNTNKGVKKNDKFSNKLIVK